MKPIVCDIELTTKNIIALMESINDAVKENPIIIYFSGYGINIPGEKMFVNYINNLNNNGVPIELIAYNKLFESAFNIFYKFGGDKKILKTTIGMIKLPQDILALREIRKVNRFMYDMGRKDNEAFIKWISPIFFSKTEGRKIRTGKEVMINNDRLNGILNTNYNLLVEPV